jgi:phosphonate transport system substrate-binding protein
MIPSTDASSMLRDAKPFVAYLEAATGREVKLTIPQSYAEVVEAMVRGQVDLGHFGGFTFVQANRFAGAIPLVQRERIAGSTPSSSPPVTTSGALPT